MSEEISLTIKAFLVNGELRDKFEPGNKLYNCSDAKRFAKTVSLTSNSTTLEVGELASNKGWCFCTNLSTANEVLLGPTTAAPFVRLFPTAAAAFGLVAGTTIMAKTSSGAATLDYLIWST
jgi:hypothetical protein